MTGMALIALVLMAARGLTAVVRGRDGSIAECIFAGAAPGFPTRLLRLVRQVAAPVGPQREPSAAVRALHFTMFPHGDQKGRHSATKVLTCSCPTFPPSHTFWFLCLFDLIGNWVRMYCMKTR
jgi:hypothetical protein